MQVPTCSNIRIRSTLDAHKIFYAVQRGLLYMVTRRLDADERSALGTGCVYAWEERGPHSEITGLGIERFTEGRRWSPSRVRDEFLFYYEKFVPPPESLARSPSEKHPPRDWDPLIKQTYSVWVDTEKGRRKWHLTAYFTQATVDRLGTVDDIPAVRELAVPNGAFKSTRSTKSRNKPEEFGQSRDKLKPTSAGIRAYAPFPGPALYPASHLNQSNPVSHQDHALSSYPEQLAYSHYYPTPAQLNHFSVNSGSFNQMSRTQSHEDAHYSPSVPTSQASYIHEASPKHEIYIKTVESSYVPEPRNTHAPYTHARHPHEVQQAHQGPAYVRVPSTAEPIVSPLPPSSYSRAYESHSYTFPNTLSTSTEENSNYMFSLSESMVSAGKQPPAHPWVLHSHSESYLDMDPPEKSPNLPPLHSVEGIQDSVYTLASPTEALIPGEGRRRTVGSNRDLAPLHSLTRPCPYRREPLDDKTLRLLRPHD
ncbi:hypothetical protein AX15_003248 [Amanita polypyramis BW_CC]|nr:hypothetical protein AX15_003248 [Amanita polypyramis BW_CC]